MTAKILSIFFLVFMPLFLIGVINRVKSLWAGRQGPGVMQPFYDVMRLLKKGEVISSATTFIFRAGPSILLSSVFIAALTVPLVSGKALFSFECDFVVFAYVMAAGRFLLILLAMDTGSSFEGMGASREAAFSALVEPAFFIILASLAIVGGNSFSDIIQHAQSGESALMITLLSACAFYIMLLAEGCRVPVDDPNTHLELTMIHEVMVLDNSGPDFAFILYASALKMVIIGSVIAALLIPQGLGTALSFAAFAGVHLGLAVITGTIESLMARLRMSHVPQFLLFMTSISIIILGVVILFK